MDPLNAPVIIIWAVLSLASVLLGGCVMTNPYRPVGFYNPPTYGTTFYGAPPAAPASPAHPNCYFVGARVQCS